MLKRIDTSLNSIFGDGVLEVNSHKKGETLEKYYSKDMVMQVLKRYIPEEGWDITLPDFIVEEVFEAERKGMSVLELTLILLARGNTTREGSWISYEENQERLMLAWLLGYSVYEGE